MTGEPRYPQSSRSSLRVREMWQGPLEKRWAVVRERGRGESDVVVATFASRDEALRALRTLRGAR